MPKVILSVCAEVKPVTIIALVTLATPVTSTFLSKVNGSYGLYFATDI